MPNKSLLRESILAAALLFTSVSVQAQTAAPMPKQPAELLALAGSLNGLQGLVSNPWHVKVTFQLFDHDGQPQPSGTFEEFWVSPSKFKRTFTSPEFTESEFGTDHGFYRVGDREWPGKADFVVQRTLMEPISVAVNLPGVHLKKKQVSIGVVKLQCLTSQSLGEAMAMGVYCFELDRPMLRLALSWDGSAQTVYDDIVIFQGRYIARNIRTTYRGKLRSTVHIERLEPLSSIQETDLAPPAGAQLINEPISLAASDAASLLVFQRFPVYPQEAKMSHVEGTVLIDILVDKDGDVQSAQVVSGPDELQGAALLAVRKWKYRPRLMLGEPLAFHSQVTITFSLQ